MKNLIIFDFYKTLFDPISESLYEGSEILLTDLKNSSYLVLVTTLSYQRKKIIKELNLNKYFDEIKFCRKKTSKIFAQIIKAYSYNNVTIIGDREEEEITIGKRLGVRTIQVDPEKDPIKTIYYYLIK